MYKSKTLNLRSQDRNNQSLKLNDGGETVNDCQFNLDKPISLRSKGLVGLRSAYLPITFKSIDKNNDRFVLKFLPAHTSALADCVFAVCQLQHGYYNSGTSIKNEVNRVLGLLNAVTVNTLTDAGGVANQYSADTTAILSADMTCSLGTDDDDLDHLIISLPDGVVFSGTGVKSSDDSAIGATTLDGGFQIFFGDASLTARHPVEGRSAHKIMGFSKELTHPSTLNGNDFIGVPFFAGDRAGTAVQNVTSNFLASPLRTPYVYIRSNLSRDCRESKKAGGVSDLLAKVPVQNTTYGSMAFYEPHDGSSLFFDIEAGDINNVNIQLTDGDGLLLEFDSNDWEMLLVFKADFYN